MNGIGITNEKKLHRIAKGCKKPKKRMSHKEFLFREAACGGSVDHGYDSGGNPCIVRDYNK